MMPCHKLNDKQRRAMYAKLRSQGYTHISTKYLVKKADGNLRPKKKFTRFR